MNACARVTRARDTFPLYIKKHVKGFAVVYGEPFGIAASYEIMSIESRCEYHCRLISTT